MPGASNSALAQGVVNQTPGLVQESNFFASAFERVKQQFGNEDWRDKQIRTCYLWKSPAREQKIGDDAEEFVIGFLSQPRICELLEEPLYLITGKH